MRKMESGQIQWAQRYQAALSAHIQNGSQAKLEPAQGLGLESLAFGFEPLDVAGIHEKSMIAIAQKDGLLKTVDIARARKFFLETIVPIEETHHAAQENTRLVATATEALRQCTKESSAAARRLEQGIKKRKVAESTLKESGKELKKLLHASCDLQSRLRANARGKLVMQETIRREVSLRLQNEIAQTLLAIHLRLLTLKISIKTSMARLQKEVAANQVFVRQSTRTIQRLKNEIDHHYET